MGSDIKLISSRKIYELLDLVKRRPEILLTSKSITALQNFLNGYMQLGFGDGDEIYNLGEPRIDNFNDWILNKDKEESGVGNPYSRVLLKECNEDEAKAFDRFFEYLDEFKRENIGLTSPTTKVMSKFTLPDSDWIIRVIVKEKGKDEVPQFIRYRAKNGITPSEQKTIAYLAKREGYKEGTEYRIKGYSAFLEEEAERFPDVME
jgi:hypothetical protein